LDRYRDSPWGTTNRQQKQGLELSMDQYKELELYSNSFGLDFIVSCWDVNSVDEVEKHLNIKYHKIASALATDRQFLEKINSTGRPVILSTGMCEEHQIKAAIDILDNVEVVLACTSTYPTKTNEVNLRHIETLRKNYPNVEVGFSNHYNGLDACIAATVIGAKFIEFHITTDRTAYGSDQSASIENVVGLVDGIRKVNEMLGDGAKRVYESEKPIAKKLRKIDDTTK
jgi:N-acetylneuraminate synthase